MNTQEQQMYNALQHDLTEARHTIAQMQRHMGPRLANAAVHQQPTAEQMELMTLIAQMQQNVATMEQRMNDLASGRAKSVGGGSTLVDEKTKRKKAKKKKKQDAMATMVMNMAVQSLGKGNPAIGLLQTAMNGGGKDARRNAANALMGMVQPNNPQMGMLSSMMQMMEEEDDDDDDDGDD